MRWIALVGLMGMLSGCGPEAAEEAGTDVKTQQGPPESWCRSYKSKQFCPSVCAWYSTPAPGYCSLKAES
jgi:hypothetical protein